MIILGVMSGSSLDGLDLALCRITDSVSLSYDLLAAETFAFTVKTQQKLASLSISNLEQVMAFQLDFVRECSIFIDHFLKDKEKPELISWHGHTIAHFPQEGYTLQMGNGGQLAMLTELPVVADFRSQDIALGGQGTPLVPIAEKYLFQGYDYYLNLGGIANMTHITGDSVMAFDVCPCNQVLNHISKREGKVFDDGGKIAKSGTVDPLLLGILNQFTYYSLESPKSIDNNWIKNDFIVPIENSYSSNQDLLRTMVEHIVYQIDACMISLEKEQSIMVTGGGTNNTFLIELLTDKLKLKNVTVEIPTKQIIDFKESILMCLLAYLRVKKKSNVLKSVTGSSRDSISGAIYLP